MHLIRKRIEQIICEGYSPGNRGIPLGSFSLAPQEFTEENIPATNLERQVWVSVGGRKLMYPRNQFENMLFCTFPVEVKVTYLYKHFGTLLESSDPYQTYGVADNVGPANKQGIEDRAHSDTQQITEAVTNYQNIAIDNDQINIFDIVEKDQTFEFRDDDQKAILTLSFEVRCELKSFEN